MARDRSMGFDPHCSRVLVVLLISACWAFQTCYGFHTLGFHMHHRFSEPVKRMLHVDDLPEKHSVQYYQAMVHRDRVIHSMWLSAAGELKPPLTFSHGNETYFSSSLGYLQYANVTVGTPSLWFLVALDTGSNLFWLPCDCTSCIRGLRTPSGREIDFNIYRPNASSTSTDVPCNSTLCKRKNQCSATQNACPYQVSYGTNRTSSTGFLVEDMLHLVTDDNDTKVVDAKIAFGCGKVQNGSFLQGVAPNGLFGLGGGNISVPSMLAREGLVANSFSMCFGVEGSGRISFGDKGSSDQGETPFNLNKLHSLYNITITQISVGGTSGDLKFDAIFDSGTSFTHLNDPAYTFLSESFNLKAQEMRHSSDADLPFEYCYDLSPNQTTVQIPDLYLTTKGGDPFLVIDPIVISSNKGRFIYCLGVIKSEDFNIIGQNFMTGHRITFDRERMVLGWKESNCYGTEEVVDTLPLSPASPPSISPAVPPAGLRPVSPAVPPTGLRPVSPAAPPAVSVQPEDTAGNGNAPRISEAPRSPSANGSPAWNPSFLAVLLMVFLSISPLF